MGTKKNEIKGAHAKKIHNQRIVALINEYISLTNENETAVYEKVGIIKQNVRTIKLGTVSFTLDQVVKASKLFGVSTDWILGLTDERSIVSIPVNSALEKLIEEKIRDLLNNKKEG